MHIKYAMIFETGNIHNQFNGILNALPANSFFPTRNVTDIISLCDIAL